MFNGLEYAEASPRRTWSALASFTLQSAALAAALTISLLSPRKLVDILSHPPIFMPISEQQVTIATQHLSGSGGHAGPVLPTRPIIVNPNPGIRFHVADSPSNALDPAPTFDRLFDRGGAGSPGIGNIAANAGSIHPVLAKPPLISRPMQGYLIRRVEPIYPTVAKTAGVQGPVLIKAVISTDGKIERAQIVSGSPWLSKAALDAIQQWRYRPYLLNDKPVEVETEITVMFTLTR